MPQIVSGIWGKVRTDDIIDRAVTRAKLEYPTEDVTFVYLAAINKTRFLYGDMASKLATVTSDDFTDKAVQVASLDDFNNSLYARAGADNSNTYYSYIDSDQTTEDFLLKKVVDGTITQLGSEAVDITAHISCLIMLSCSGSTIKAFRNDMATPKISVTDTDLTSGGYGPGVVSYARFYSLDAILKAPATQLSKPLAVIEVEITGKGTEEDPIRPKLPEDLRDPKELGLNLNKPQINLKAVSYGLIDYKGGNTALVAIYEHGANYLDPNRIQEAIDNAINKFKVPSNVQEAEQLHKELRKANPDMVAGKHTIAYHLIGDANIEPCSVADFYHGNLIQEQKIKGVPEWELRRTLLRWKDRLEKARINSELKDSHLKKLNECLKR